MNLSSPRLRLETRDALAAPRRPFVLFCFRHICALHHSMDPSSRSPALPSLDDLGMIGVYSLTADQMLDQRPCVDIFCPPSARRVRSKLDHLEPPSNLRNANLKVRPHAGYGYALSSRKPRSEDVMQRAANTHSASRFARIAVATSGDVSSKLPLAISSSEVSRHAASRRSRVETIGLWLLPISTAG